MRLIHQIWYQGEDKIPDKYKKYRASVRDMHPNCIVMTWDNNKIRNLLKQYYPKFLDWYDNLPMMIQRIDVAKYFILDACGGAYIDMDILMLKPITELYSQDKIVVGEIGISKLEQTLITFIFKIMDTPINNGIILSPKGHPFWKKYLVSLRDVIEPKSTTMHRWFPDLYVLVTTGPLNFTDALYNLIPRDMMRVLEPKYLEPQVAYTGDEDPYSESYIIHDHDLSWAGAMIKPYWEFMNSGNAGKWLILIGFLVILVFLLKGTKLFS